MEKSIYLVLENGQVFEGKSFGATGEITGEIVFTTSMVGYLEALTDPSYVGQIVVQTFPMAGNYGVMTDDFVSNCPRVSAYIVREWCQEPSNFRCEGNLDTFLKEKNIIGLCGIDTRQLTRIIRERGVMNAKIVTDLKNKSAILAELKKFKITDAVKKTTCQSITETNPTGDKKVVLMDFGATTTLIKELESYNCHVVTVPAHTTAEEILAMKPDGILLSDGGGDPKENSEIVEEVRNLMSSDIPMLGICLGHQILALANGAETKKLKYGHRGSSQPVKDLETDCMYITSQNHGYIVDMTTLPMNAKVTFINANDETCEGLSYEGTNAFSVQFHPDQTGGPRNTMYVFDRFAALMGGDK